MEVKVFLKGGDRGCCDARALAAFVVLAVLCVVSLTGARRMFRGVPLGEVKGIDASTGAVSVDLGRSDGVMTGMVFSVVDENGMQAALVTPADIYDNMFWSKPLSHTEAVGVRPGMQVRWVLTPQIRFMLQARKRNTPEAYREFAEKYPDSPFLPELVRSLPDETLREIDPDYYAAWKLYTVQGFQGYLEKHKTGRLAGAARAELEFLKKYEAEKAREKQDDKDSPGRRKVEESVAVPEGAQAARRAGGAELANGRLVNNSPDPVRFEFDPPGLPPTLVQAGAEYETSLAFGTYTYRVFGLAAKQEEQAQQAFSDVLPDAFPEPGQEAGTDTALDGGLDDGFGEPFGGGLDDTAQTQQPLVEGTVDIMSDFWTVEYP